MHAPSPPHLRRVVSRWQIVGLALNDVIGSGVYLLPAAAAAALGPSSVWAVLLAGLAVALLVLCFAEASSYFEEPGSSYLYARTAFGPLVGVEVGWLSWLARVASVASLSVGFAQALSYALPRAGSGAGRAAAIVLPLLLLTGINVIGTRWGVAAALALLSAKGIPLVVFVACGLFAFRPAVVAAQPPGRGDLGQAALLLLFAYAGFENTPVAAGEYRNPRRDVPFALLAQVAIVTLLYVAVQWVALGTRPDLASATTPLADAAEGFLGRWAGLLLTAGAALSILGTNSNTVFAGPRYLLALAHDGYGPRWLERIHPRFGTPANAVLLQTAIALPLALSGGFEALAALSVVARLGSYLGTAAAVPVLRRRLRGRPGAVRLPLGPTIPLVACLLSLGLLGGATRASLVSAAAAVSVGGVLFLLRRRK